MPTTTLTDIRAVIFDVHGTLLSGGGPMRFDPEADVRIQAQLDARGYQLNESPTQLLELAVKQHHARATVEFPEIDLRTLWADLLGVAEVDTEWLCELEHARQPLCLMPGARETLATLSPLPLGLLSNAQADTLPVLCRELGSNPFAAELCVLSYEHGIAKPSARFFEIILTRLRALGIPPQAAVMVGNDPQHDIVPARKVGLKTVLLSGPVASRADQADAVITDLSQLPEILV